MQNAEQVVKRAGRACRFPLTTWGRASAAFVGQGRIVPHHQQIAGFMYSVARRRFQGTSQLHRIRAVALPGGKRHPAV